MKAGLPDRMTATLDGASGLERIVQLEAKLARAPLVGRQHRELVKAIGIEAAAYRLTLDAEQATATHDPQLLAFSKRAPARRSLRPKSRGLKRS